MGPSLEHYWCIKCFMPDMAAEVDADIGKLIPHMIPIPSFSDENTIRQTIGDIIYILKWPEKMNIPTVMKGDPIVQVFENITALLGKKKVSVAEQQAAPISPPPTSSPPSLNLPPLLVPQLSQIPVPPPVQSPRVLPSPTSVPVQEQPIT
eukprot:11533599-Ditylum_brightwellii.AAC.1